MIFFFFLVSETIYSNIRNLYDCICILNYIFYSLKKYVIPCKILMEGLNINKIKIQLKYIHLNNDL